MSDHLNETDAAGAFQALKALPVSAVILDATGRIISVNDTWKEFARKNGLHMPDFGIGTNYFQYCQFDGPQAPRLVEDLRELLAGRIDVLTFIYPCHSSSEQRWYSLIGLPLSLDRPTGVALLHVNLTDMLPHLTHARPILVEPDPSAGSVTISDAIEHSVSQTLASQLSQMIEGQFTAPPSLENGEKPCAPDEALGSLLSERQMQVLRLLGEGKTNKEIAAALFRSPYTIKLHVSAILQRLKLRSRTEAALLASRLLEADAPDLNQGRLKSWIKTDAA
ncbi:LuxR C-terminal-related transcriptional regulator [Methyloferula stellata]|uniref:LuxR C-terminal-related transcriptional regulator n=1 Tax=Methyloferula stellata TaxID=876270 RepID=UPI0003AACB2F|nr:LuxR C-terminal-related transcriptional regulator [Methyloferula stellata]